MIPLANRLAEDMQVYIPDYPGCGWSDKPADPPNVSELTDIICKWMDALHIKQATFVGSSVGSQVAIDLAYRYPDRVARLVLTGVSPEPGSRTMLGQYGRQLLNMQLEPISMKMIYFLEYMQTGLLRMFRMIQRNSDDPIEEKLPYLTMPVLIIRGKRDLVVSQAWSEKVTELLPLARLQVIPGKAHSIVYSAYDQVADMTLGFMKEKSMLEASTGSVLMAEISGSASATL
jgi:2-hydroxy-6-oxonona-2,4-dienedioate hydrolase